MALVDANGNPLGSVTGTSDNGTYVPENMVVIGGLIHKISGAPEFTFQVIIPFDKFKYYMDNPNTFTRFVNHTAAYAYGVSKKGQDPSLAAGAEAVSETLKEISEKFSMSLSEPLAVDFILKDTTDVTTMLGDNPNEEGEAADAN